MATIKRRVAVVGCAHGELDKIYSTLQYMEQSENIKIDLVLCCGDFQAVRNELDLDVLACPPHYRSMNSFWKYYAGLESAPYTTVFIGGNHEASNYLWELYYGGWVAPNIYYLGAAGVISYGGIRIGGLSGIYKPHQYRSGHFERPPYSESEKRSIYYVREYDVQKLMQLEEPVDIFMTHDWPRGIAYCGDMQMLLRYKPFLEEEIAGNTFGSQPSSELLHKLKPSYWFSAHLHTKFPAIVRHPNNKLTRFLALDKCLPGRPFLQVVEVPTPSDVPLEVGYDREWLAITRAYNPDFPLERRSVYRPPPDLQLHRNWINSLVITLPAPPPFEQTVPSYDPSRKQTGVALHVRNPQTLALLQLLQLPYLLDFTTGAPAAVGDPNEVPLDDDDEDDNIVDNGMPLNDPNEIPLDEEEEALSGVQKVAPDPNEIPLDED